MAAHGLLAVSLGAIVGAVLALTGAGGGILAVPLLVFGLGLSMSEAAPIGLLAVGLAASVGAVLGLREGIVRYRAAMLVAAVGVACAPIGLWLAHRLPEPPIALAFALVLGYVAQRIFRDARRELQGAVLRRDQPLPCAVNPEEGRLRWTLPCARALAATGAVSGLLSGLLGVGGGFVIVPALTRVTDLDVRSIVATSLLVIALVSVGSVAIAAAAGVLRWDVGVPFALGAAAGLMGGRRISRRLSGPRLQQAFAIVAFAAMAMLLWRAATS